MFVAFIYLFGLRLAIEEIGNKAAWCALSRHLRIFAIAWNLWYLSVFPLFDPPFLVCDRS